MSACGTSGKESTCQCRRHKRCGFNPWVRKIPWRMAWQPTPVSLPKESHGQRSLAGYSPWNCKEGKEWRTEKSLKKKKKENFKKYINCRIKLDIQNSVGWNLRRLKIRQYRNKSDEMQCGNSWDFLSRVALVPISLGNATIYPEFITCLIL